jgi:hypothetical protein
MGRFDPEDGVGDRIEIQTFGGNFGRSEPAGWHLLLDIQPSSAGSALREGAQADPDLLSLLTGDGAPRGNDTELIWAGVRVTTMLLEDIFAGRIRQLFLKQFRDATDGTRACYQTIVEGPAEVRRRTFQPSERKWDVTIHPLDTHPIGKELGVESQRASFAFDVEFDLAVENGVELGRSARANGEPAPAVSELSVPGAADIIATLIDKTIRQVVHRIPHFDRIKIW